MPPPFPGMDPYLEQPGLWPTVHYWLLGSLAAALRPAVQPKYWVAVEHRTYEAVPDDLVLVGVQDATIAETGVSLTPAGAATATASRPVEVVVPAPEPVQERYLVIREPRTAEVVTVVEILSPANKRPGPGREQYLEKREAVLGSRTNQVEIDLLRTGSACPRCVRRSSMTIPRSCALPAAASLVVIRQPRSRAITHH